jgi:hypothetical protein
MTEGTIFALNLLAPCESVEQIRICTTHKRD